MFEDQYDDTTPPPSRAVTGAQIAGAIAAGIGAAILLASACQVLG